MTILNVTPDSFSDGGNLKDVGDAVSAAAQAVAHGARVLDVGGESTRPGAKEVPWREERDRVTPVIVALRERFPETLVSVDTRKSQVARAAMVVGAAMINDVSGLCFDPAMARVAAETGAWLVIMHSAGTPETMQDNPRYDNVVNDVLDFFRRQTDVALQAGVSLDKIWLDPGFGFGKTLEHNLTLLSNLDQIAALGFPLLVGTSRKSFLTLGQSGHIPPQEREALTSASLALALQGGARMVRIHDPATQVPVVRFLDRALGKA